VAEEGKDPANSSGSFGACTDDVDKLKFQWAFNMPAVLLVQGPSYWDNSLKQVHTYLQGDLQISVRKTLAAGLKEIIGLIEVDGGSKEMLIDYVKGVLKDIDEVRVKVMPALEPLF